MATGALTKILKSLRYARSLANWRDVARAAWEGGEVAELRLRNGVTVSAAAGHYLFARRRHDGGPCTSRI